MKKRMMMLLLAAAMVVSSACSTGGKDASKTEDAATTETSGDAGTEEPAATDELEEGMANFEESGVKMEIPDAINNTKGLADFDGGELVPGSGIYLTSFTYVGVTHEWEEKALSKEEVTEEEEQYYYDRMLSLPSIIAFNDGRTVADAIGTLRDDYGFEGEEGDFKELKKVDDITFYKYFKEDQENLANLDEELAKEFKELSGMVDEAIGKAEFFKPKDAYADLIGKQIKFETTDIAGNKVKSEEIFAKNDYTMINVWATWCHWCVEELPELEKINNKVAEKKCGIIGLLGDGEEEEAIVKGRKLLEEADVTYLNVVPWEGALTEDLDMQGGWPTSFFVDSTGKIVTTPLVGAQVDKYEEVFDGLLSGEAVMVGDEDQSSVTENKGSSYRIYVMDESSKPVKGAMVQFCSSETCHMLKTDDNGLAEFKVDKDKYTVHLLGVPSGYKASDKEYTMPDKYSDLHVVVEKE